MTNPLSFGFGRSEAEDDLGTPHEDNAGFLYRACILSVIIDGFEFMKNWRIKDD